MEPLRSNRYKDPTFYIKNGSTDFADKQKNIFDLLTVAEKEHTSHQEENNYDELPLARTEGTVSRKRARSEMKQFRGKESIFKKPEALPPSFKNRDVPDYHKHPHKWIKYSLADVPPEDMSDKSNTAAALQFLKEMKLRKEAEAKIVLDDAPQQIIFRPQNKSLWYHNATVSVVRKQPPENREHRVKPKVKPSFRSSKLVMPEYVVGEKKKVEKKKIQRTPSDSSASSKEIKLLHLMEEDVEEEEEG